MTTINKKNQKKKTFLQEYCANEISINRPVNRRNSMKGKKERGKKRKKKRSEKKKKKRCLTPSPSPDPRFVSDGTPQLWGTPKFEAKWETVFFHFLRKFLFEFPAFAKELASKSRVKSFSKTPSASMTSYKGNNFNTHQSNVICET